MSPKGFLDDMLSYAPGGAAGLVASMPRLQKIVALELTLGRFQPRAIHLASIIAAAEIAYKNQLLTDLRGERPGSSPKVGAKATGKTCG
jgi:hypothetical protein